MHLFERAPANGDIYRQNVDFQSVEDLNKFCNILIINNPNFTSLEISSCKLPANYSEILQQALQKAKTLNSLIFFGNNIGDTGAIAFAKLVAQRTDVQKLRLGHNNITVAGVKGLAENLKNSSLTELYLNENLIGDAGAPHLAAIIKQNDKLQKIHFGNNSLSKKGFLIIVEALKDHPSLKEIDLTILDCELNDDCKKTLREAIQSTNGRLDIILSYHGGGYSFKDIEQMEQQFAQMGLRQ